MSLRRDAEVVVVGAGQAGLAAAYHLRRAGLAIGQDVVVLDAEQGPGGAWRHAWDSLTLFSPADHSSLPGWMMPPWREGFPPAAHVRDYLRRYEERYELTVERPVTVRAVRRAPGGRRYEVETDRGRVRADHVVNATGTWRAPFWPTYPGQRLFRGRQLHAADYRRPDALAGQRVVVVGGGNSAAQLLAEVSTVAQTVWVTQREPRFLPDDVDGRVLFDVATRRATSLAQGGHDDGGVGGLGDVVMVPAVRAARERGVLVSRRPFERMTRTGVVWPDGQEEVVDVVLWCTGFRPVLAHLAALHLARQDGHPVVEGTQAVDAPGLHLLGHGDWTGTASATLIGVGRTAKAMAEEVTRAGTG